MAPCFEEHELFGLNTELTPVMQRSWQQPCIPSVCDGLRSMADLGMLNVGYGNGMRLIRNRGLKILCAHACLQINR
jgi:ribose 5-phosphate isomerase RpiB